MTCSILSNLSLAVKTSLKRFNRGREDRVTMGNISHNSCLEDLGQACEQEHVILAWLGREYLKMKAALWPTFWRLPKVIISLVL